MGSRVTTAARPGRPLRAAQTARSGPVAGKLERALLPGEGLSLGGEGLAQAALSSQQAGEGLLWWQAPQQGAPATASSGVISTGRPPG